jgi:hypothetical protein
MAYCKDEYLDESMNFNNKYNLLNEVADNIVLDRGLAKIWSFVERSDGSLKKTKINVYTSGFMGSRIRNAETGEYYKDIVGSRDEELYFKVAIATGELKAKNESNTLFYTSPEHYMSHLNINLSHETINKWYQKRDDRLALMCNTKKNGINVIVK